MNDLTSTYRELLLAAESVESLQRALQLLMQAASGRKQGGSQWYKIINRELSPSLRRDDGLATLAQLVGEAAAALSNMPRKIVRHVDKIPPDQYSLLIDTLLLVFHHAYFAVLPEAGDRRELLLASFEKFAAQLTRPADQFQVRGLVQLERGESAAAVESFDAALAATHSDEHDFLTRVQLLWSVLMERAMRTEAFDCLMDAYRRASLGDLDEIEALLRQTFSEAANPQTSTRPLPTAAVTY